MLDTGEGIISRQSIGQTEEQRVKQKSMYPKAKFFKYKDKWRVTVQGQAVAADMNPASLEQYFGVCGGPLVYVIRQVGESTLRVELRNGFITRASICPGNVETLMSGGTEVTEFTLDYVGY